MDRKKDPERETEGGKAVERESDSEKIMGWWGGYEM